MGDDSALLRGLKSDAFRNSATAVSALCAIAALWVSILSYQNAAATRASQEDVVKRRGEFLELGFGFVELRMPQGDWKQYSRQLPTDPVKEIPLAEWESAESWVVGLRLFNSGQQDAYLEQFTFDMGNGEELGSRQFGQEINAKCTASSGDQGPCPETYHPYDGYPMYTDIPKYVVASQTESRRAAGLRVCVESRTGMKNCLDVGVAVPAGAK